jgi:hypothetical protein
MSTQRLPRKAVSARFAAEGRGPRRLEGHPHHFMATGTGCVLADARAIQQLFLQILEKRFLQFGGHECSGTEKN